MNQKDVYSHTQIKTNLRMQEIHCAANELTRVQCPHKK
jgi:hypothetical protein